MYDFQQMFYVTSNPLMRVQTHAFDVHAVIDYRKITETNQNGDDSSSYRESCSENNLTLLNDNVLD